MVSNVQNIIEAAGINVILKNEFAGGGVGELAVFDSWLELWVHNDEDHAKAMTLLEGLYDEQGKQPWHCPVCKERNEPAFELCWKCGREVP